VQEETESLVRHWTEAGRLGHHFFPQEKKLSRFQRVVIIASSIVSIDIAIWRWKIFRIVILVILLPGLEGRGNGG
jgi:hypothetical protein